MFVGVWWGGKEEMKIGDFHAEEEMKIVVFIQKTETKLSIVRQNMYLVIFL
ncbi:MAG: hypothetical protein J6K39_03575 [Clostridia bacterium]|nr:hypothetical protein [Clostridia bacterium]